MMQFAQCQNCVGVFSYKSQNGSNNLKMYSQTCMGNVDNTEKIKKELSMYSLRLAISGVGVRGLLEVCMNIAQNIE
eukprot:9112992-Ditylum_brightwellii.AAC.1